MFLACVLSLIAGGVLCFVGIAIVAVNHIEPDWNGLENCDNCPNYVELLEQFTECNAALCHKCQQASYDLPKPHCETCKWNRQGKADGE